jgi:AraC family transcriptional regulator
MTAASTSLQKSRRPYGEELAEGYGAERGPFVVSRSLPQAELAVTEIKVVRPFGSPSTPRPRQDAYMIVHHFQDLAGMEYWEDGRSFGACNARAGGATIHDLRREPVVLVDRPFHTLQWFVPHTALNVVADEANAPYIDDLRHDPCVCVLDDVISHMSTALLPALTASEQVNRIFVDYVTMAFAAHLAHAYGGMQAAPRPHKGGLAPWQQRQAREMLLANLTGETPLAAIAAACGLSSSHFARAFRRSTGLPPHAWLNKARVERAMMLLRQRGLSLSEIALECGFVDQSHFTRIFMRRVGFTPGIWRRMVSN